MERLALLAVTAHPGDEIAVAGTLAQHARGGVHVALICATEGAGEEQQCDLRCACDRLGIAELYFLGYHPSEASTGTAMDEPGTLLHASARDVVRRIVYRIRDIRPQVMITFGPRGLDGHVDHIAIGQLTTQAFGAAADLGQFPRDGGPAPFAPAKLYYFGLPDGLLQLAGLPPQGTPDEEFRARRDVSQFVDLKIEAARCYRTLNEGLNRLLELQAAERRHLLSVEFLSLAQPQPGVEDARDPHLFAGVP